MSEEHDDIIKELKSIKSTLGWIGLWAFFIMYSSCGGL
jgi:hypothetical protein